MHIITICFSDLFPAAFMLVCQCETSYYYCYYVQYVEIHKKPESNSIYTSHYYKADSDVHGTGNSVK